MEGVGLQPSLQPGDVHHEIRPIRMRLFVEWFSCLERAVFRGVYGEISALFQTCVGNFHTIPQWKVNCWNFILIVVVLLVKILLSWAFVTSLNCSIMCKPLWWFECYFRCSSWIHCWLLLTVLSDYFGQLVTSIIIIIIIIIYIALFSYSFIALYNDYVNVEPKS